jgi:hypothetical protein
MIAMAAAQALGVAGQFASGLMSSGARQAEFAESLRQLQQKKEFTVGLARTRAAATGFDLNSGSTMEYLRGLTKEFDIAIGNLRRTARTTRTADLIGTISGAVGGAAQTYGSYRTLAGK